MFAPWDILALSFVISYDPYVWLPYQFILAGAADLSEKAGEETIKCSFAWLVILHDQNFGSWIRQEMIISIDRWLWLCLALPDTEFKDSLRFSVFNTWFLNVDDNVHCTLFNDCIDYFSLQGASEVTRTEPVSNGLDRYQVQLICLTLFVHSTQCLFSSWKN